MAVLIEEREECDQKRPRKRKCIVAEWRYIGPENHWVARLASTPKTWEVFGRYATIRDAQNSMESLRKKGGFYSLFEYRQQPTT